MIRRCLTIALILALVLILACTAWAQYQSSAKSRIGIRATAFRPSSSQLSGIKSTWISPTVDYNLRFDRFDRPSVMISASMFSEQLEYQKVQMIPITVTAIKRFGDNPDRTWYAGGGVGIYSVDYTFLYTHVVNTVVNNVLTPQTFSSLENPSGKQLGFNFVGGLELSASTFLELRYDAISKLSTPASDVDFSGLSISFGTRIAY